MSSNPADGRPYLADPDYYRLGYQLAAQLLNREHAVGGPWGRQEGGGVGQLRDLTEEEEVTDLPGRQEAFRTAEEVLLSAREMRCWYGERAAAPRWQFWVGLSRKDERLMRFLELTVEPCLELIIAAAVPEAQWNSWVSIALLRKKAEDGRLSYRAVYNLSCHEASDGEEAPRALDYLRLAFRLAPSDRRRELVKWATKDPSLVTLRKEPDFKMLLQTFGVP